MIKFIRCMYFFSNLYLELLCLELFDDTFGGLITGRSFSISLKNTDLKDSFVANKKGITQF